jgi:transformer-2 protein
MSSTEEAQKCIDNLNGTELQGRRIRVDFSTTHKPHNPTPGAYMGQRRPECTYSHLVALARITD